MMSGTIKRNSRSAVVAGAGPVGICSAILLQRDGYNVTVYDPRGPGEGCTGGNTGSFGFGYCAPQALPGIVRKVPKMLRDPMHPLKIRYSHAFGALPWFMRFASASEPGRVVEIADALAAILGHAERAYVPLIEQADATSLVRMKGRVWVYESKKSLENARRTHEICRARGVAIEELDPVQLKEFVPQLKKDGCWGAFMPGNGHVTNPLRFVQKLAELFVQEGGTILRDAVENAVEHPDGQALIKLRSGSTQRADALVVAAGAWSRQLAKKLGDDLPLEAERGYNMILPEVEFELRQPIVLADRFVAVTSMDDGLRLGGVAEYAHIDAAPDHARAERLFRHALTLFGYVSFRNATQWMGPRPAVPDSLPFIGRSSRLAPVIYACGHGHAGLTLGAISGQLVADIAGGREPVVDLAPFSPYRFNRTSRFKPEIEAAPSRHS